MNRTSTWSFATIRGSVHVAPGELRIHRSIVDTLTGSVSAIAAGRLPPMVHDVGWSGVAALMAIATVAMEWSWNSGASTQLFIGLLGVLGALGGGFVSVARNRTVTVPLEEIDHVDFGDEALVIVHGDDGGGDGSSTGVADGDNESAEETVSPLDDEQRADAALALKLRGVDLRGVEEDEIVSRTVVDAPKTELVT